jgi:enoyl-CoA hydratase/carnithine racemase
VPDVALGLTPSGGGAVWLSRLPFAELGLYAAMTGAPLDAADQLAGGIATHWLNDISFAVGHSGSVGAELATLYSGDLLRMVRALELHSVDCHAPPPLITRHSAAMEKAFAARTAAGVVAELRTVADGESRDWAHRTADLLESHCPLAVSATLRLLRELRHMPLADAVVLEHRVARRLAERGADVFAALESRLEHGKAPKWSAPATLSDVRDEHVDALFAPPASGSTERKHELSLVAWNHADHIPAASLTLALTPTISTTSPRAAFKELLEERELEADVEVSMFDEAEAELLDPKSELASIIENDLQFATRDGLTKREDLHPTDRI